jgi:hypothetical protein
VLPSKMIENSNSLDQSERKKKNLKFSLTVTAVGIAIIAICLIVFFTVLEGTISFGN